MSMVLQLIRNTSNTRGCEESSKWEFLCLHTIEQTEVVCWKNEGHVFLVVLVPLVVLHHDT